jgi:hypothetical protein
MLHVKIPLRVTFLARVTSRVTLMMRVTMLPGCGQAHPTSDLGAGHIPHHAARDRARRETSAPRQTSDEPSNDGAKSRGSDPLLRCGRSRGERDTGGD